MNHLEARALLSDLLAGQLDDAGATGAWEHIAGCPECREVLPVVFQVRSAVAIRGPAVFSPHPPAETLVQFALADRELPIPDVARIGRHVRDCAACNRAVEITRDADAATASWYSAPFMVNPGRAFARIPRAALVFVPALAILVLLLAYPAYRGIVRYPELRRTHAAAARDLARLESEEQKLRAELARRSAPVAARAWAGPTRLLFLPATMRGTAAVPGVALGPDQLYQPIVVQHRPFDGNVPTGIVTVRLLRPSGETVWSEKRPVADLWDPSHSALVLLVPAAPLEPGGYRLEVVRGSETRYQAAFTVQAPAPLEKNH